MNWEGFAVARPVSDRELSRVIASTFGVDRSIIVVVARLEELLQFPRGQVRFVVVRWPLHGEFRLWVEVVPHGNVPHEDDMETMRKLAGALRAALLIPDESLAPSTYLRVWPDGRIEQVIVDSKAFDDRDEVVIVETKPAADRGQ